MSEMQADDVGLLGQHWNAFEEVRRELADELDARSLGVGSSMRKQLILVSDLLRTNAGQWEVARRPDALAFVMPLVHGIDQGQSPRDAIGNSVHRGVCLLARHGSGERKLSRVLLLPFLLTMFAVVAMICLSHFILPQFEELYREFGIALPRMTDLVLGLGRLVRRFSILIFGVASAILPVYWLLDWFGRRKNPASEGMVDRWLSGKRMAVARWLFHASLLLEAGLDRKAFVMASESSGSRWLTRRAKLVADQKTAFAGRKFAMAQAGIEMPQSQGRIAVLRQVATWYRDNSGNFFDWWIHLFVSMFCWMVVVFFFFVIAALLMPVATVISGLTGGGPGGFF